MSSYPNTRAHASRLYRWVDNLHHRPVSLLSQYEGINIEIIEPYQSDESGKELWYQSTEPYRYGMYVDPNGFMSFEMNKENGYEWCYGYRVDENRNMTYECIRNDKE